jgi:beta-N-acetylhexosaminidase
MWTRARRARSAGSGRAAIAALLVLLAGCATSSAPGISPTPSESTSAADAWADSLLATLSPRERAAQLVWPWLLADYSPEQSASWQQVRDLIEKERVGGFVISVGTPTETAAKTNAMQRLSTVPLIFGADYEAGVGYRTRGAFFLPNAINLGGATTFSMLMALGASRDSALAYEEGRITAVEGRALGVHVAFAPVLDVNNNPNNPVIGPRSFGEEPALVASLGASFIRGLQENGMFATAKHFPGHGDTDRNSHLEAPTILASRARLDSVELRPFRRAIGSGVAAIMTFHGVVPSLDPAPLPATLSRTVMTGLLRRELGFQGLLITDALDMNGVLARVGAGSGTRRDTAISGNYGTVVTPGLAEVVKVAMEAGNDVLLMPLDVTVAIDAVVEGVAEGRFTQARVDSSARRILRLKHRSGLHERRFVSVDSVRRVVGAPAHVEVADRIAERGITLAVDSFRVVPFVSGGARPRVLSVTIAPRADLSAGTTFDAELRRGADVRSVWVDAADPGAASARALALADSVDHVVIGSYIAQGTTVADPNAPAVLIDFVRGVVQRQRRTVVVAFGNPYLFQQIPFAPAYMVAWGGFAPSQRAAARALLGSSAITGRLPISIPPALRLGAGEDRDVRAAQ